MSTVRLVCLRILRLFFTLFIVSTVLFVLLRIVPGDPARVLAGLNANIDEEAYTNIRESLGLDLSLSQQFGQWMWSSLSLNFGYSWQRGELVGQLIAERIAVTLSLAVLAMLLALAIAIPAGILAATRHTLLSDRILRSFSHTILAVPEFWLAILLLLLFAVYLPVFPLFGSSTALHFVLPVVSLALARAAFLLRIVRRSILQELDREYIQFFAQLGVPFTRLLFRHALPNASIPIIIPAGIQLGYLLGGAIIIEEIFSMGGLGRLLFQAIQTRDFPLIHAVVMVLVFTFSLVNFLADTIAILADPKSRL